MRTAPTDLYAVLGLTPSATRPSCVMPTGRCFASTTRFVHLQGVDDQGFTEIALDGCGVVQGVRVWRGTDALRSTLAGALGVR